MALVAVVAEDEVLTGVPFDTQHVSIILEGQVCDVYKIMD